ncbi:unnamed protein product, partial [Soboliphyme baturini]|uniref:Pecanex-like protein n=1 Tax=Soboliphyme baturini TaxID=241478 RepID=A0A183IMK6_9BILA
GVDHRSPLYLRGTGATSGRNFNPGGSDGIHVESTGSPSNALHKQHSTSSSDVLITQMAAIELRSALSCRTLLSLVERFLSGLIAFAITRKWADRDL